MHVITGGGVAFKRSAKRKLTPGGEGVWRLNKQTNARVP